MKASYYSHIPTARAWKLAGQPVTPSQQLTSSQLERLAEVRTTPPDDALHHIRVEGFGYHQAVKIESKMLGTQTRHLQQGYLLELNIELALLIFRAYSEYTAREFHIDMKGLKHALY